MKSADKWSNKRKQEGTQYWVLMITTMPSQARAAGASLVCAGLPASGEVFSLSPSDGWLEWHLEN